MKKENDNISFIEPEGSDLSQYGIGGAVATLALAAEEFLITI